MGESYDRYDLCGCMPWPPLDRRHLTPMCLQKAFVALKSHLDRSSPGKLSANLQDPDLAAGRGRLHRFSLGPGGLSEMTRPI